MDIKNISAEESAKIKDSEILYLPSLIGIAGYFAILCTYVAFGFLLRLPIQDIIFNSILCVCLAYMSVIDVKKHLVANICPIFIGGVGLIRLFVKILTSPIKQAFWIYMCDYLPIFVIFAVCVILSFFGKGLFGGGDIKTLLACGLHFNLIQNTLFIMIALLLFNAISIGIFVFERIKARNMREKCCDMRQAKFAFVPYIAVAFVLVSLFGSGLY